MGLPTPSGRAWLIDLDPTRGSRFVVLRLANTEARRALADHLTEIGAFTSTAEASKAVDGATVCSVGVVW